MQWDKRGSDAGSYDWVIDLDIKGFFDNIDHELLMRAVRKHAKDSWVVLYISRWLKAPAQDEEGRLTERGKGTPQGGVISPLLANLFLHYAFDGWMRKQYPQLPFERYADDAIVHCRTEAEATGGAGGDSRANGGMPAGASSGEDEDRLLQG